MLAVTNTSSFSSLTLQNPFNSVVPTATQINTLIGSSDFVNSSITTAIKNLFIDISNFYYNTLPLQNTFRKRVGFMFNRVGFFPQNGILLFTINTDALDEGTRMIIEDLNDFKHFREKARNAFRNNSWAQRANDIRGMQGSGLEKLHYIGVYNAHQTIDKYVLNTKNEKTGRFVEISSAPKMPKIRIVNFYTEQVKVRIKIDFTKSKGVYGTGAILRKFLDYFPEEQNGSVMIYTLDVNTYKDVDFGSKIRGGNATIEFVVGNASWSEANIKKFKFYIRGINPDAEKVKNYLEEERTSGQPQSAYLSRFWFLMRVIRHESKSFGTIMHHFNDKMKGYEFDNNQLGLPNYGEPIGYGLGQIDNFGLLTDASASGVDLNLIKPGGPKEYQTLIDNQGRTIDRFSNKVASDDAVWNWKKNIDTMIDLILIKISEIKRVLNNMKSKISAWDDNHSNDKVVIPSDIVYTNFTYSWVKSDIAELNDSTINDLFTTTQVSTLTKKSFFDAMILKYYNGTGKEKRHYLYLTTETGKKPTLSIQEIATVKGEEKKYVELISKINE